MNITVFTSNQPRHVALIDSLAQVADHVCAIQECNTIFPGQVADFFARSEVMQRYFARVLQAERKVFGPPCFPNNSRGNIRQMPIKMGDLNLLSPADLGDAMQADLFIVFGASYIRGELCRILVERKAINIHMGISPQYRGSSCNFWALYDDNPHLVGATLHLLSGGLDSGPMICHALPPADVADGFELGMRAVAAAHQSLIELIRSNQFNSANHVIPQDRSRQIRYTKNADFTDAVANEYLARGVIANLSHRLAARDLNAFVQPYVMKNIRAAA